MKTLETSSLLTFKYIDIIIKDEEGDRKQLLVKVYKNNIQKFFLVDRKTKNVVLEIKEDLYEHRKKEENVKEKDPDDSDFFHEVTENIVSYLRRR